jgi:RNA polymerase sigma-70 factor (ECF subfamily)
MKTEEHSPVNADEAMSQYAQGNDQAFGIVYDTVAPRLEGYLRRHLREPALVEDIIQHTFLQMHDKRGTFCAGAEVIPWAFSIARNFMIDVKRKTKREAASDGIEEQAAVGAFLVAAVPSAEQVVEARQTSKRMAAVFESCTEHQRAAFELTKGDGLSQSEAAQVLNTTVMGIKQCAHKVYEKLRAALKDPDEARPAQGTPLPPPATL